MVPPTNNTTGIIEIKCLCLAYEFRDKGVYKREVVIEDKWYPIALQSFFLQMFYKNYKFSKNQEILGIILGFIFHSTCKNHAPSQDNIISGQHNPLTKNKLVCQYYTKNHTSL